MEAGEENQLANDQFAQFLIQMDPQEVDQKVQALNREIAPKIDCTACGNCCKTLLININEKEADAVLDGAAGKYFNAKLEAAGLVNLAYWENGFRNLTNSKRPVTKLEDFDGVKVRVMQNNIFLDTFKTLGTNAVPMAFGEVFTALETKTIDGQENPFVTIETSKFNEVQKYLSVTRHAYTPFLILYSKKLWDQLNPQEQAVLREAAMEGQKVQRAANRALNEKSLASLKTKGMQVNEVSSAEQNRIRAKVASVYDKHKDSIGADAIKVVQDELKKSRGG